MSRDQNSSSSEGRPGRPDLVGLDVEQIEAARLAEILTATELGAAPDLDPIEDPALASLARTANMLRLSLESASATASFGGFHQRSRAHVLAAVPQPRREPAIAERRGLLDRWNGLFTSVGAAGAASVATFVVTALALGGGSSPAPLATVQVADPPPAAQVSAVVVPPVPDRTRVNLTALSITEQVSHYVGLLERLNALNVEGQPADEDLLRDLADTSATVKRTIEQNPDVNGVDAFVAMHKAFDGQRVLSSATVASEADQQALITAQEITDEAYVTAARFLGDPDRLPSAADAAAGLSAATAGPAVASASADSEEQLP